MTTFDEREQAFEAKLAHDEELKFKAIARRNKWLGLWAAEKLGRRGAGADEYAAALVSSATVGGDVFKKIRADFDAKHVAITDQEIRRQMDELSAKAAEEVIGTTTPNATR